MTNVKSLKPIAKAIKELDSEFTTKSELGSFTNVKRKRDAREKLINIIFSNGFQLDKTYRLKKNTNKKTTK